MRTIMGGNVLELESEKLLARGKAEGKLEGEECLSALINRLIQDGKSEEIQTVVTDKVKRKELYEKYGIQ